MNIENIISCMRELCSSVTDDTYDDIIQQNYDLLKSLHQLGVVKEKVYWSLYQYYNSLEENLVSDCVADVLDFIVGWCALRKCVWK